LVCYKIGGLLLFVEKNGEGRRNEGGGKWGYSPNYKLNITDKFTNIFN
jgi:hypothetical protein